VFKGKEKDERYTIENEKDTGRGREQIEIAERSRRVTVTYNRASDRDYDN